MLGVGSYAGRRKRPVCPGYSAIRLFFTDVPSDFLVREPLDLDLGVGSGKEGTACPGRKTALLEEAVTGKEA